MLVPCQIGSLFFFFFFFFFSFFERVRNDSLFSSVYSSKNTLIEVSCQEINLFEVPKLNMEHIPP